MYIFPDNNDTEIIVCSSHLLLSFSVFSTLSQLFPTFCTFMRWNCGDVLSNQISNRFKFPRKTPSLNSLKPQIILQRFKENKYWIKCNIILNVVTLDVFVLWKLSIIFYKSQEIKQKTLTQWYFNIRFSDTFNFVWSAGSRLVDFCLYFKI